MVTVATTDKSWCCHSNQSFSENTGMGARFLTATGVSINWFGERHGNGSKTGHMKSGRKKRVYIPVFLSFSELHCTFISIAVLKGYRYLMKLIKRMRETHQDRSRMMFAHFSNRDTSEFGSIHHIKPSIQTFESVSVATVTSQQGYYYSNRYLEQHRINLT